MTRYHVITKRIVSPDGKVISEVRSVATSVGNQTEVNQSVSIDISSDSSRSCSSSSSSSSSSSINRIKKNT